MHKNGNGKPKRARRTPTAKRIATIVGDLTRQFAENPNEDAMIDAAAESLTGDASVDAEIVDHVHAIWLLMEAFERRSVTGR